MFMNYLYNLATDRYKGFGCAIIKFFLFILSLVYCLAVKVLVFFYRSAPCSLGCKVISVGNITLGGTGKTSLVEFIAGYLRKQGHKVAILSRGYKRKIRVNGLRVTGYEKMGDEPYMLSKNLGGVPVIVDVNRVRAANLAIKEYGVDTVILDDGFQQWRISKDLEIVAVDATNPFGNRHLIPRGILREPLSSLKRANVFILTKVNLNTSMQEIKNLLSQINTSAQVFESTHKPIGFYDINKPDELLNTDILKSKTVTLVSGIGDPVSFESLTKTLGINIGLNFAFEDHHSFSNEDLDKIAGRCKDKNIDTIITTEKDAVRLGGLEVRNYDLKVFVLRISLSILDHEQKFCDRLLKLYSL